MRYRPACRERLLPRALVSAISCGALAGCVALAVPEAPPPRQVTQVEWSEPLVREHLRFFNGSDAEGRATASRGYARAAAYVAARMKQFGLQPALHGDYRLVYQTPLNYLRSAEIAVLGADTLGMYAGVDFLPDARSDSGDVTFRRVMLESQPDASDRGSAPRGVEVVMIRSEHAGGEAMASLRDLGFHTVLIVGPLRPGTASNPIPGLLSLQITPQAAAVVAGLSPDEPLFPERGTRALVLERDVRVRVASDYRNDAGALNVFGYLSGRDPVFRNELIIVCTHLDAVGRIAGVQTIDLEKFGIGAAALLEVSRNYGNLSRFGGAPERTLLFAVFSGSRLGDAGLRAYLQNPLWSLDQTAAVLYIGLPADREPEIRNLLAPFDIPLYAVQAAPEPLHETALVALPEPGNIRRAGIRASTGSAVNMSEVLSEASRRAQMRAEETHDILYPLSRGRVESPDRPFTRSETVQ